MPVKLDVANSIISAYVQGKSEAVQAEELRKKQEQTQLENQQRQEQIDAQKKQFEQTLKNEKENQSATHAHEKAVLDLQHLIATQGFIDAAEKSGNTPSGFTTTGQENYEISPGVFGSRIIAKDQSGNEIRYRTPETAAGQQATLGTIERKPLIDEAKKMEIFKEELARETSRLSEADKLDSQKQILAIEAANKATQDRADNLNKLEIARLTSGAHSNTASETQDTKSYNYHNNLLEKNYVTPLDSSMSELTKLQKDLLGMGTLQADKLIAPQLIKILVGGTGSGIRITQGEIAQIAGGQTTIDEVKARLNKFLESDQNKAMQILPAQRAAIQNIITSLANRTRQKQLEVSKAGDIIRAEGVSDQDRKNAINNLEKKLRLIDNGEPIGETNEIKSTGPIQLKGGFSLVP